MVTFQKLSEMTGISDNNLRKRVKRLGIPVEKGNKVMLIDEKYIKILSEKPKRKIFYKISVKIDGRYIVKHCSLTRKQALAWKEEYDYEGFITRISTHYEA